METAVRLNLPIVAMVWEDGDHGSSGATLGPIRTSPRNPDWVKLAESFGWEAERVDRSKDLGPLAPSGPTVLPDRDSD